MAPANRRARARRVCSFSDLSMSGPLVGSTLRVSFYLTGFVALAGLAREYFGVGEPSTVGESRTKKLPTLARLSDNEGHLCNEGCPVTIPSSHHAWTDILHRSHIPSVVAQACGRAHLLHLLTSEDGTDRRSALPRQPSQVSEENRTRQSGI